MKGFSSFRAAAASAIVLGALGAASMAHARSDVHFSIGLNTPGVYVQPAPVYVQPAPVYVRPAPVYGPPVYVQPAPVYVQRSGAWGDRDRDGVPNIYDRHDRRHGHHHHRGNGRHGANGDLDGDGVPNRHDRFPDNRYYR